MLKQSWRFWRFQATDEDQTLTFEEVSSGVFFYIPKFTEVQDNKNCLE